MTERYTIRERHVLKPSQLNQLARSVLEDALALVWVEGEISNFSRASSGHWYFTLKDASAQIRCAMFRGNNQYVRAKPGDGVNVLVRGRVTLYEARGEYQLVAEHMEDAGAGQLHRQFEALKAKLAAEGLTDVSRKRALPSMPRRLALITSPRGAAISDVLSVLARRWPLLAIEVFPCQVQGTDAPAQLTDAVRRASSGAFDVILLARGGGAAEDLAAFNDEVLARAIAASAIPVVSAVGHEIDVTIADFVADIRAPTPSAAAEMIAPDREAVSARLRLMRTAIERRARRSVETNTQRLDQLARLLRAHQHDGDRFRQRIELLMRRMHTQGAAVRRDQIETLQRRLLRVAPDRRLSSVRLRANTLQHRLSAFVGAPRVLRIDTNRLATRLAGLQERLRELRQRTQLAQRSLQLLGPQATLERGFVLLQRVNGELLTRSDQAGKGELVSARFADGERSLQVQD